ncbi:MAG: glycine cleavage system protein H [Verrucomicrobiota bacterium]
MKNIAQNNVKQIAYKRSHFSTRLPVDQMYSPSHFWLKELGDHGVWQIGFTKFATRMLGEIVECEFDVKQGELIEAGQVIGWIEGFKAASDLYSVIAGEFGDINPLVSADACIIRKDPYRDGWLYSVKGKPDPKCVDVHGYVEFLDRTIDKMQEDAS